MSEPTPWMPSMGNSGANETAKLHAPATLRNRDAIANVLRSILQPDQTVLEIASGSGEHIVHFARAFPDVTFVPSDMSAEACASIAAWTRDTQAVNIRAPVLLDVQQDPWPALAVNAALCINMVHIAPWAATAALFAGCARLLDTDNPLYLYGPYLQDAFTTAPGNVSFDASLKSRNPDWGLRRVADMDDIALVHGFDRETLIPMPANNLSLVYRKK